jgi:hypothetical protein
MKIIIRLILLSFLSWGVVVLGSMSCGGGTSNPVVPPTTLLYVLDTFHKAVFVVDHITTVNGVVDPSRTITGDNTLIQNPTSIAVDDRRDILYVGDANQQAVLVFAPASQENGDVAPSRQIPASGNIQAMTLDVDNNRLYVFNATLQAVQVWNHASTVNGTPPDNTFTIGFLASSMFIDNQRDILYVGDPIAMAIQAFAQASTTIGNAVPVATITDTVTPFDRINSLSMNVANNFLFMANSLGPLINEFDNASQLTGSIEATRVLQGDQTTLSSDLRYLKFLENVLYVNNDTTQIAIWNNANSVDGNIPPDRLITVNGTTNIIAFDIDLRH